MADNDTLNDDKRKKFDECYKMNRDQLPECPRCKSKNDICC